MESKILKKWSLFIVGATGIAFSLIVIIVIFLPDDTAVSSIKSASHPEQTVSSVGLPIHLKIPKINVDAAVEQVGLAPDGTMDVPKDFADVAWLNKGPRPGETGSAVVSGHYSSKNWKPSAFDNLYKLRKGDTIYVEDDTGVTTTFVVRESRRYDPNADAQSVFVSNDGKAHLNLITCEGVWDPVSKSYSKRLVIFTDKEMAN